MAIHDTKIFNIFLYCLFLVCFENAGAVDLGQEVPPGRSTVLGVRSILDLTSTTNSTAVVQKLDFMTDCAVAISWFDKLPTSGAGFGNDSTNVEFLRMALPAQYLNESDDQISTLYNEMSFGNLSRIAWFGMAKNVIQIGCIAPQIERQLSLASLDPSQNCTSTAQFLSSLGWLSGPQVYTANGHNENSWLPFLRAALPATVQSNITELELFSYRTYFLATETIDNINSFLREAYDACQRDLCEVQGYTGNPDIGGIGVSLWALTSFFVYLLMERN